jgi:metal-responsive CopG/Arc/MetJ family transcriptional regulator
MSDTIQIGVRLTPAQLAELDRVAEERRKSGGQPRANRSDVVRELIAWGLSEGFFGKGKKR